MKIDKESSAEQGQDIIEKARKAYLKAALPQVPFEGWTEGLLRKAEKQAGFQENAWRLYFPEGVLQLITFWFERQDRDLARAIELLNSENWKVRDRIRWAVKTRILAFKNNKEAARRAKSRLLLPDAGLTGYRLGWKTADTIWRGFKDRSTDGNYTSKRLILSAVYASTLQIWLSHETEEAWNFLDRRIENIMHFEKFKAKLKTPKSTLETGVEASSFFTTDIIKKLAKIRYHPAGFFLRKS